MTDEFRLTTREVHKHCGLKLTSGAGQLELLAIGEHDTILLILSEEQGDALAGEIHRRTNQMRNLRNSSKGEAERKMLADAAAVQP